MNALKPVFSKVVIFCTKVKHFTKVKVKVWPENFT